MQYKCVNLYTIFTYKLLGVLIFMPNEPRWVFMSLILLMVFMCICFSSIGIYEHTLAHTNIHPSTWCGVDYNA